MLNPYINENLTILMKSLDDLHVPAGAEVIRRAIAYIAELEVLATPAWPVPAPDTTIVPAKWSDWVEWTGEFDDPVSAEFCEADAILEVRFRDGSILQDKPSGFDFRRDPSYPFMDIVEFRELSPLY